MCGHKPPQLVQYNIMVLYTVLIADLLICKEHGLHDNVWAFGPISEKIGGVSILTQKNCFYPHTKKLYDFLHIFNVGGSILGWAPNPYSPHKSCEHPTFQTQQ